VPRDAVGHDAIRRLHYGYIVAPDGGSDAGQPIPVCGYLVEHPRARILFDTGLSPVDDATRQRYRPRATAPEAVLGALDLEPGDIDLVVNCHLHVDHAGGNDHFPDIPIYIQRAELELARAGDHTFPEFAYDFPRATLRVIDGETELVPGVRIVPTPGHTAGHQAVIVDTDIGPVLLAGQAFTTASEFGFAAFSHRLVTAGLDAIGESPGWMSRVHELDPIRTYFAHDLLVHERDSASLGVPRPL
jgi:glyoxylase-like metal-dependent hydrolase (beta-lactamase superfamily II)